MLTPLVRRFALLGIWSLSLPVVGAEVVIEVEINGPLILGNLPPGIEAESSDPDSGAAEAIAHVTFAIEDTLACLKEPGIQAVARISEGQVLSIQEGAHSTRITLPADWPLSARVYLLAPGRHPRNVSFSNGLSALGVLLPEAAAAYFGATKCAQSW